MSWKDAPVVDSSASYMDAPEVAADATPEIVITAPKKEKLSWGDVAAQAIVNTPKSAINFGQSIIQPILHPIETAKGLTAVGGGLIQHALNVLPERVTAKLPKMDTAAADAVGKYFVDRYGSEDGIKQALAEDPVGVASDLALLLTGGGAALKTASTASRVGELASAAGRAIDPMTYAAAATRKGLRAVSDLAPVKMQGAKSSRAAQKLAMKYGVSADALASSSLPTAAEAIGPKGAESVRTLARREGTTGEKFATLAESRKLERPDAMLTDFAQATGVAPEAAAGNIESFIKEGRAKSKPLYEEAKAQGPMMSPTLQKLLERPAMADALKHAVDIAANEGMDLAELGFEISNPTTKGGLPPLPDAVQELIAKDAKVKTEWYGIDPAEAIAASEASYRKQLGLDKPTVGVADGTYSKVGGPKVLGIRALTSEGWDLLKRGLDEDLKTYRDPLTKKLDLTGRGGAINATRDALRKELVAQNKPYEKALATSGEYKAVEDAFNNGGQMLFNPKLDEQKFAKIFENLGAKKQQGPSAAQNGFKAGIAKRLYDLAQNDKLDPKIFKSPRVRAKLEIAMGPKAVAALEESATRHASMQKFENMRVPGVTLREAVQEQDDLLAPGTRMASDFVQGGVRYAGRGMASKAVRNIADIASRPWIKQRNAMGETLLSSPQELADELRKTETLKNKRKASVETLAKKYLPKGKTSPLITGLTVVRDRTPPEEY